MKLIRFGEVGKEKPGIIIDGQRKDCSAYFQDWNHAFLQQGGLKQLAELIKTNANSLPTVPENTRWGSCVARPGKVVCIGLNYKDHAKETNAALPAEPIVFLKASNTVVGPYDNIIIPRNSHKTDWEVELSIIIKKDTRYLASVADAKDYIAGYAVSNDVSEREFQIERGGQWTKGKSCDTFFPLGPFLMTADEIKDVNNLAMELKVNGVVRQSGNTSNMIFDPLFVVHYLSQFMTLEAGDVISTGTPAGVGLGMKPPTFLKAGDQVDLAIEGLGTQKQICVNAE